MEDAGARAEAKVREAEAFAGEWNVDAAAGSYREAAALYREVGNAKQASICGARADYYEAQSHGARQEMDMSLTKVKRAIEEFQTLAEDLWTARCQALLSELDALRLLTFDKFDELKKTVDEGKRALEKIRKTHPSEEKALRNDVLALEQQLLVFRFFQATESKEIGSAVNAIRESLQINAQRLELLTGVEALACEVEGDILRAREAQTLGEESLEKWSINEATTSFGEANKQLSSAAARIGGYTGAQLPKTLELQQKFVQGAKLLNDGLIKLAQATSESIEGDYSKARQLFADASGRFDSADNSLTKGGGTILGRWARKARRYSEVARAKSGALKLSRSRFVLGAGKQSAIFTLVTLAVLSLISLRVNRLTSEQIVYGSILLGLIFGFGLDAIRFKDILPWGKASDQKSG